MDDFGKLTAVWRFHFLIELIIDIVFCEKVFDMIISVHVTDMTEI